MEQRGIQRWFYTVIPKITSAAKSEYRLSVNGIGNSLMIQSVFKDRRLSCKIWLEDPAGTCAITEPSHELLFFPRGEHKDCKMEIRSTFRNSQMVREPKLKESAYIGWSGVSAPQDDDDLRLDFSFPLEIIASLEADRSMRQALALLRSGTGDVLLRTRDATEPQRHIHSLMLRLRCPLIFTETYLRMNKEIDWSGYRPEAVELMLHFLYTGDTVELKETMTLETVPDFLCLAGLLQLRDLIWVTSEQLFHICWHLIYEEKKAGAVRVYDTLLFLCNKYDGSEEEDFAMEMKQILRFFTKRCTGFREILLEDAIRSRKRRNSSSSPRLAKRSRSAS